MNKEPESTDVSEAESDKVKIVTREQISRSYSSFLKDLKGVIREFDSSMEILGGEQSTRRNVVIRWLRGDGRAPGSPRKNAAKNVSTRRDDAVDREEAAK